MNAIKAARKLIASDPASPAAKVLSDLVLSLEADGQFQISSIYTLELKYFELAMKILEEWRIDRYVVGKAKLFDLSYQVRQMNMPTGIGF